jgi:hypothetical protein
MGLYNEKKAIALGLALPPAESVFAASEFDVAPTATALRPEAHNQYFDKKWAIPPSQNRYKIALVFMGSDYEKDKKAAKKNLAIMNEALSNDNAARLKKLLADYPAAEWLSCVFLDENEIDSLIGRLKNATSESHAIVREALEKELQRLVDFTNLFERIIISL